MLRLLRLGKLAINHRRINRLASELSPAPNGPPKGRLKAGKITTEARTQRGDRGGSKDVSCFPMLPILLCASGLEALLRLRSEQRLQIDTSR